MRPMILARVGKSKGVRTDMRHEARPDVYRPGLICFKDDDRVTKGTTSCDLTSPPGRKRLSSDDKLDSVTTQHNVGDSRRTEHGGRSGLIETTQSACRPDHVRTPCGRGEPALLPSRTVCSPTEGFMAL